MDIGVKPKVFSKEKIFTPITSASKAFVIKKPANIKKSLVGLLLIIEWIIQQKNKNELKEKKKEIKQQNPPPNMLRRPFATY
jgi:hypothetical protein